MSQEADAELARVLIFLKKWGRDNPIPQWKEALLAMASLLEIHMHRIENLDLSDVEFVEAKIRELANQKMTQSPFCICGITDKPSPVDPRLAWRHKNFCPHGQSK